MRPQGNRVVDSTLSGNSHNPVYVRGNGNNFLDNTHFSAPSVLYEDTGTLTVRYTARAFIKNRSTNVALEGASVTISDKNNVITGPLLTDINGFTPYTTALTAIVLSQANPTGANTEGNPYTIVATKDGFTQTTLISSLLHINQEFTYQSPLSRRTSYLRIQVVEVDFHHPRIHLLHRQVYQHHCTLLLQKYSHRPLLPKTSSMNSRTFSPPFLDM